MMELSASSPWPADPIDLLRRRLGELDDRETRLLATGIGEHIPHEILVNVEQLHLERASLLHGAGGHGRRETAHPSLAGPAQRLQGKPRRFAAFRLLCRESCWGPGFRGADVWRTRWSRAASSENNATSRRVGPWLPRPALTQPGQHVVVRRELQQP